MTKAVRKAVFPVAGLGTRFLPATKANAKEMLPIVDKPLIQYAAEEAVASGITDLIFITGRSKRSIEDHFDRSVELELELASRSKHELLAQARGILPDDVTCIFIRQAEPLGLGHAVLCARAAVGDAPFAVILPDDLIVSQSRPCIGQMIEVFEREGCSVVAVEEIPPERSDKYGVVGLSATDGAVGTMQAMVEKPPPDQVPSNLGVVGRYVLPATVFDALQNTRPGAGGEIQLTDAIAALIAQEGARSYRFEGVRYDCGNKLGFLQATVELALEHPELKEDFAEYLRELRP